jgi:hypothetical protein
LTLIESEPGVVPLVGVTESQFTPDAPELAAAVKLNALPLLVTTTVCGTGAALPGTNVKPNVLVLSVSAPEVTWRVTGIVTGLFAVPLPAAVIVIVPLYVPPESNPGFADTVITFCPAAVEPALDTASQLPPLLVVSVTV